MTIALNRWSTFHPSAYTHAGSLARRVAATPRPHGAIRYRCPVTRSFVVVTDDATLATLERPHARLRCPTCGEMHLLSRVDGQEGDANAIVADRGES